MKNKIYNNDKNKIPMIFVTDEAYNSFQNGISIPILAIFVLFFLI